MRNGVDEQGVIYADCAASFAASGTAPLDALRGSHVLVTGATGFVGSWLLAAISYLNDAHSFGTRVTAVAKHRSNADRSVPFLTGRADIQSQEADVRQLAALPDDVEWIVHAAGVPDSRHHATNPIDTVSVIAEGTLRVLRLAEQATKLRQILHISSGLVDASARHRPAGPTLAYEEAKRFSETLCYAFRSQAKLPIVITRPYTLLGPFQRIDSPWAANDFLHAAIEGQPLKIRGDGSAVRSYLYGSDMAMIALHQLVRGDSGAVYDLGGVEPMPVVELANIVAAKARRPLDIRIGTPARAGVEDRFVPDMDRVAQRLGVQPAIATVDAVARSLAWYANRPS